jgi:hypothetical protein
MAADDSICWARLPRSGLGNKLLVWGRALVFARINGIPLHVTGWNRLRLGPLIRREVGRQYFGQFQVTRELNPWKWWGAVATYKRVHEPAVTKIVPGDSKLYVFSNMPHWGDYFEYIRDYRETVRSGLFDAVAPFVRHRVQSLPAPVVSLHVRHGDFRWLKSGEDFAHVGLVRTPIDYFEYVIDLIRSLARKTVPVTVFSDGAPADLEELLALPCVRLHQPEAAAIDLLLMSRSKIIVPSAGSTFGYWAAFLSEAAVLLHPQHIHAPIRPADVNSKFFEGPTPPAVAECPPLLRDNIRSTSS